MPNPRPSERPSFRQRDSYLNVLAEGYAHGRLDDEELRRRAETAGTAATLAQLEKLISDLPRGDLPVPAEPSSGTELHAHRRSRPNRAGRKIRRIAAAVLVGLIGGIAAGNITTDIRRADAAEQADVTVEEEYSAGMEAPVSEADVFRVLAVAGEQETVTRVRISGSISSVDVPTVDGTNYDTVAVHPDGQVVSDPGGTYDENSPETSFAVSAIDPAVLATMVEQAPEVYADITGETGNPVAAVDIGSPSAHREYAGVPPETPVVRVRLGMDEYRGGGAMIIWTADGSTILEVADL